MKILIIEDDKFIRTVYKSQFNQENFEVELAQDGEEGWQKIIDTKPDLILLDMILPKKDGFSILEDLQKDEELQKIPVIVFSALSQQSDIDKAMKLGAKKYLPKDQYTPKQIIEEIKKEI